MEPGLLLCARNTEPVTKTLIGLRLVWHYSAVTQSTPKNLRAVLASFDEHWAPRTIALVNDYDVRVAKVRGDFPSHRHLDTDEFFLVLSGELTIAMDDHEARLGPGDTYVVPRGVRHQPSASEETEILLFEPSTTVNTGDRPGELTARRVVVGND